MALFVARRARDATAFGRSPRRLPGSRIFAVAAGRLIETVQCWTRAEWDAQGVDVDKKRAEKGVAVIS